MNPSIEIPFVIGETVWWVGNGYQEEFVTCPECLGSKAITMILGNGEQYSLRCEGCSRGYEGPFGVVTRIFYKHVPEKVTLNRVEISGNRISYSVSGPDATCYSLISVEGLFSSESKCASRCEELNIQRTKDEEARM